MGDKIAVIAGPTATGKTRLGIALARALDGEIVSADSMQVYRGMDIGTAKATPEERAAAPHHMLDVAEPGEDYSVARYVQQAALCCEDIIARGKLPIVVGGTGLYIDSLIAGRDFAAAPEDRALRAALSEEYDRLGGEELHRRLAVIDPERAALLPPADRRRIVRALEIYALTGETATEHDRRSRETPPRFDPVRIILSYEERARLYERINSRVDAMFALGLTHEVEGLLSSGVSPDCTAMQAIGYKETAAYLRGELSLEQAAELIKMGSRRYAKRQLTWFSKAEGALWIRFQNEPDFEAARRLSTRFLSDSGIS